MLSRTPASLPPLPRRRAARRARARQARAAAVTVTSKPPRAPAPTPPGARVASVPRTGLRPRRPARRLRLRCGTIRSRPCSRERTATTARRGKQPHERRTATTHTRERQTEGHSLLKVYCACVQLRGIARCEYDSPLLRCHLLSTSYDIYILTDGDEVRFARSGVGTSRLGHGGIPSRRARASRSTSIIVHVVDTAHVRRQN